MIKVADAFGLFRDVLQGDTTSHADLGGSLASHLGGRIYPAATVDADAGSLQMPCIIVDVFSGEAQYGAPVQELTVYLYGYSKRSSGEALAIYQAAAGLLQGTRLIATGIGSVGVGHERDRPITGHNQGLSAWFARGTWTVTLAGT